MLSVAKTPCLVAVLYILLSVALTYPLLLHLSEAVPSDIGDPLLNTWILAWDIHALITDPAHLFDANIFYPLKNTLAYSEHLLGTAFLAGPFYLAFGEPVLAYNVAFLLSFALGGFGMYLLALRHLRSKAAAFLAGLAFAFAPYRLAAFSHIQLLTAQWIPFALLFLDDFLRYQKVGCDAPQVPRTFRSAWHLRSLGLFCFFLLLQAASSWHLAAFTAFIVAVYAGAWWLAELRAWPLLVLLVLAGLAVCATLLPLALPYLKVMEELKAARPVEVLVSFSARPGDFLAAAPQNRLFGALLASFSARPGFTEENFLFPGFVAPLLALASLLPLPGHRELKCQALSCFILWAVALGALAFTFGPTCPFPLPYSLLTTILPFASLIRVPPRWATAMLVPLSLLAGYGYIRLMKSSRRFLNLREGGRYLFPLLAFGLVAESFSLPLPLAHVGSKADLPVCYRWLAQNQEDFAILEIPFYTPPEPEYPESKRLYASTIHWKALVNGYSGLTPSQQMELGHALADFPGESALSAIRNLAPRYVIVHSFEEGFDRAVWEEEGRWLLARSLDMRLVHLSEGNYVYEVNPYGPSLLTAPEAITDSYWQERIPRPVRANFGGLITLLACEVNAGTHGPALTLYWQAQKKLHIDYTVFVHLLDEAEAIIAQGDSPPVAGHYPTSSWKPGEIVRDEHPLDLGEGWEERGLRFRVGLYRPEIPGEEGRLPLLDAAGEVGTYVDLPSLSW